MIRWKLGNLVFWLMRVYLRYCMKHNVMNRVDVYEVLVDEAESLTGAKCVETSWDVS